MRWIGILAALLLGGCSEPNGITASRKAQAVAGARDSLELARFAESVVRSSYDPSTKVGRQKIREAAESTAEAQDLLNVAEGLKVAD